jgi:hypothetical protein
VPTVVMVGSADRSTPPSHCRRLAAGIRGAQLITVADAGDMLNWEAPGPEVLVEAIGSFQRAPLLRYDESGCIAWYPLFAANLCLIPPHPFVSQRLAVLVPMRVGECELAASGPALGSPLKPRRGWCRRRSRRITVLGQQPIQAALHQLIAHQQQHVIESALPILTPRHTPIFSAHPTNPVQARRTALLNQRRPGWSTGPAAGRVAAARRLLAVLTDA